MKNKSLIYKIILVIILVILCFVMIHIGRGHTLYFDNKQMKINGSTIDAPYRVKVFIKGKEVANLSAGDRGMAIWIGPKAHIDLEVTEVKGGDKKNLSCDVPLPKDFDGVVINLIGLMNNAPYDTYISEFVPLVTASESSENEEVVIDELGELGFGE